MAPYTIRIDVPKATDGHPGLLVGALSLFGLTPQAAANDGAAEAPPPGTRYYEGSMSPAAMLALAVGCLKLVDLKGLAQVLAHDDPALATTTAATS